MARVEADRLTRFPVNLVRHRFQSGQLALGTYITLPTGRAVDVLSDVGLDFVRLEPFRYHWDDATTTNVIAAANRAGLTPWARIAWDRSAIVGLLERGVQIITVPEVDTPERAREVVSAVRLPPLGARAVPSTFALEQEQYRAWVESEVLVGCQIETAEGIANYREIIAVEGVDIIHTGRNDIAQALGVPGEQFHPRVLEVERRIVEATLAAGKQPSLLYPLTEQGLDLAADWVRRGVRIFALDMDYRALHRVFAAATTTLRAAADRQSPLLSE